MNMKKMIPGILAAFILMAASSANAGGANWSFSVNLHNGHPTFGVHVGHNRRHMRHHSRWNKWSHKRRHHHRGRRGVHHRRHAPVVRHRNFGHKHGHRYHSHRGRHGHRH